MEPKSICSSTKDRQLSVNSTLPDRICHPINGKHVTRDAVVHAMSLGGARDIIERSLHHVLKLLVYNRFLPEVSLAVLRPFKSRAGCATSAAQNIRHHGHPLF